jgi:hypothetical protein
LKLELLLPLSSVEDMVAEPLLIFPLSRSLFGFPLPEDEDDDVE